MPTPPSTEDTGKPDVGVRTYSFPWKFWKRKPKQTQRTPEEILSLVEKLEREEEFDPDFIFGLAFGGAVDAEAQEKSRKRRALRESRFESKFVTKQLPGLGPREYRFGDTDFSSTLATGKRLPMAPRSALYIPRPLNSTEAQAVALAEVLEGVKPKGPLKKKVADLKKGKRRVIVQPDGKLVDVK